MVKSIILAAGKGTRMKSDTPKVLHQIFNKTLLGYVIDAVNNTKLADENYVIVGHQAEKVEEYVNEHYDNAKTVLQSPQLGTGHAVSMVCPYLEDFEGEVIILCGDTPLITSETLKTFIAGHRELNSDITVMSAVFDNPTNYGRIVRNADGSLNSIVEEKDATVEQKAIKEINAGIYCLNWAKVKNSFSQLKTNNAQGEYYLTDIIKWAKENRLKVCGYVASDNNEIYGINSRQNLAVATKIMNERKLNELMENGVTIVDTFSTFVSPETQIDSDTIIYPNTYIEGKNTISKNCKIGPMAHFRGNCTVGQNCKIGNFVELKNAKISDNTNVCHLSYVGDAILGKNVNIGAGTIFANYNSITKEKKSSVLADGVSIGSNSVIVAPVELGKDAFVAGLSCITKDVEENSLAITRASQKEIKNWVKTKKENK